MSALIGACRRLSVQVDASYTMGIALAYEIVTCAQVYDHSVSLAQVNAYSVALAQVVTCSVALA